MPCMKDYGRLWDYENGTYHLETRIRFDWKNKSMFMNHRKVESPRYRKIANQYGVCKFVRIGDEKSSK